MNKQFLTLFTTTLSAVALSVAILAANPFTVAFSADTLNPINSSGVVLIDLPASSAESIRLDIKQARLAAQSVGRLILDAQGIDFKKGALTSLGAEVQDGNFDNILVDKLTLNTTAFSFDTLELLNHRRFVLDHAINAAVSMKISEQSLNKFVSNPKTIEKIQKAVSKKTGGMNLISFSNPSLKLMGGNRVKLTLNSTLGNAVVAPMELNGNLAVKSGKLSFENLQLKSNGTQLPVDISDVFEKKLNEMIDLEKLGKNNFVIQAEKLSVTGKMLEISGNAALTRLDFGN